MRRTERELGLWRGGTLCSHCQGAGRRQGASWRRWMCDLLPFMWQTCGSGKRTTGPESSSLNLIAWLLEKKHRPMLVIISHEFLGLKTGRLSGLTQYSCERWVTFTTVYFTQSLAYRAKVPSRPTVHLLLLSPRLPPSLLMDCAFLLLYFCPGWAAGE